MKVDIYQFYIVLSEYTLTFSNHFFKIIELASSSSLKQTKRNMISAIKKIMEWGKRRSCSSSGYDVSTKTEKAKK